MVIAVENENQIQITLIEWLKVRWPDVAEDTIHIANQRKCTPLYGRLLMRMGLAKGASDLFIPVPKKPFHGYFLELKTKHGKLTQSQRNFIDRMKLRGYKAQAAYGIDDAIEKVADYLIENDW